MQTISARPSGSAEVLRLKTIVPRVLAGMTVVVTASLMMSCGGSSSPPAATPAAGATAVIGVAGGTLIGPDGVQVVIPAGALNADTTIGIARSSAGAPATFTDNPPAGGIYEFTPHNLIFNLPVTLRMPVPAGGDGSIVFMASPGEDWQATDATVTAGIAEWTRNSFSWGNIGLACTGTATLANLYICSYPSGGANASAVPATAITRLAFGNIGLYSGSAGAWAVTEPGTVNMTLNYRAAPDCGDARVKLIRWNPAVPVTPNNPATIVFEQAVSMTTTLFSLQGGTFACTGTTNLDGTACGSYLRGIGSTTVAVPFSHLDSTLNATGTHAFGYSFSCKRPQNSSRSTGGDLMTFKVSIPVPSVTFSVGGTVSGLTGSGLVLSNPGSSNVPVSASGSFTFSPAVGGGTAYSVAVLTQPSGQTCTVTNGTGIANANISNVAVNCVPSFSIGGTVSGLAGPGLVLQNNGGDNLSFTTSGPFSFLTRLVSGSTYNVTILSQPSGSTCSVANGSGTATADVTNVAVTCISGGGIVLATNSTSNTVSFYRSDVANGTLNSLGAVNTNSNYPFAVVTRPDGRFAYVANLLGNSISVFAVDKANGTVVLQGAVGTLAPYSIAMDPQGRYLYAVKNSTPSAVSSFFIDAVTGALSPAGISVPGGLFPFVISVHPSGNFVYSGGGGAGSAPLIYMYSVNTGTGQLTALGNVSSGTSSGPGSIKFHPNGQFAYVAGSSFNISIMSINTTTGLLTASGSAPANPSGTNAVEMHPSGQYLYALVGNNVLVYSVNGATGALTLIGSPAPTGTAPSALALDSTGSFLYITNQTSKTVSSFNVNAGTGLLSPIGSAVATGNDPQGIAVAP